MFRCVLLTFASFCALVTNTFAADEGSRLYEMRIYFASEGKLDALHARFRDHTLGLFEKHGMTNVGYFVPAGENPERKLVYFLSYPNRQARDASWKAFINDPLWKTAYAESEKTGPLVARVVESFLSETDYSPDVDLKAISQDKNRVFELRTYTASRGNLPALNSRFREHTLKLFQKHGMTNLIYWNLADTEKHVDAMLIYLLAHKTIEASKASFDEFRKDPEWIKARTDSEQKAGGSLTAAQNGVVSEFLVATDYSPLH